MKSVKYLLDLQQQKKMTDTALAQFLGVSQPAISHYKSGRRIMDDEACLAVAMALNLNPMEIVGAACIDRAEKTGQKSLWEVFMNRTTAVAASVLMATSVNLFLTPAPAEAATMRDTGCHKANNIDYANLCVNSTVLSSRQPGRQKPPYNVRYAVNRNAWLPTSSSSYASHF